MADCLIMIVDDNKVQRMILEKHLQDAGYKVVHAENGARCLELMETLKPDLILLDVYMPIMDGFETLYAIKNNSRFSDVPVLFLTNQEQDFKQIKGLELGADDYVTKPFNARLLLSRIKAVLRRTKHYGQTEDDMGGRLSKIALSDLMQSLAQSSTATTIILQEIKGEIIMKNGFLLHVRQGFFTGDQALIRLLLLNRGSFTVKFDDAPEKISETQKPVILALVKAMTGVDEVRNFVSRIPAKNPHVRIEDDVSEYPSLEKFKKFSPIPITEMIVLMEGDIMNNIKALTSASKKGKIRIMNNPGM